MPIGNTPINQLNALPLVTAQSVGDPGEVVIIGNTIVKHWNPTQLGVSGVSGNVGDPDKPGSLGFVTNFIDVRGCNFFRLAMVRRVDLLANDQATTLTITVQTKGTSDGPSQGVTPRTGDGGRTNFGGQEGVIAAQPAPAGAAFPFDGACGVGFANALRDLSGVAAPHALVGASVRLFFWSDAPGANASHWNWWAELWGQG